MSSREERWTQLQAEIGSYRGADYLTVPDTLMKSHALITKLTGSGARPSKYHPGSREGDRRRHLMLHTIFVGLERNGAKLGGENELKCWAEIQGEKVYFELREQHRQERVERLPTDRASQILGVQTDLSFRPTGMLKLTVGHTRGGVDGRWQDNPDRPLETIVWEIVGTILASGRRSVEVREREAEAARQQEARETARRAAAQSKAAEVPRWNRFVELSLLWDRLASISRFIDEIERRGSAPDWISWARGKLRDEDPLKDGVDALYVQIAETKSASG